MTGPPTDRDAAGAGAEGVAGAVAVLMGGPRPDAYLPAVQALRRAYPLVPIFAGDPDPGRLSALVEGGAVARPAESLGQLINEVWDECRTHVLVLQSTVLVARGGLDAAIALVEADLSVATVSFLSNAAGPLSFPHRNHPIYHQVEGLDEHGISERLRSPPAIPPAPIAAATGPAVLLSSYARSAIGPLIEDPDARSPVVIADFSLRGRRRGFFDMLDPSSFCTHAVDDLAEGMRVDPNPADLQWLVERHPFLPSLLERDRSAADAPLGLVHAAARAKVLGVSVLIDGSCLGPRALGTQVQTIALIDALARRPDIERVAVNLATDIPPYAAPTLDHPKVVARRVAPAELAAFGTLDIAHRPYQPDGPIDLRPWRTVASRVVVTVLDLIAYRVGSYHSTPERWLEYRRGIVEAATGADALIAPTHDVARQIAYERIPVDRGRVFTVPIGTDHLESSPPTAIPGPLLERGFAGRFLLVLGANYAHKNRDGALATLTELLARGHDLSLVLAGPGVPFGSSRTSEAARWPDDERVFVLPDVTAEERNWLLRHAEVVLYPTSAEGIGLVPYEAARLGTPTVMVPAGPLAELSGSLPVSAADWSAEALADATEALLSDRAVADAQVRHLLAAGGDYSWDACAAKLVEVYRTVLALPARSWEPSCRHG
ncbi:MAG TPA: glycosyltransferase [Acidimicrobiales bacterium]|nr:glycosyltransferase [Acidimicrobiales bacterium]